MWEDTIVARASAEGAGAIGMLRISGTGAHGVADRIISIKRLDFCACSPFLVTSLHGNRSIKRRDFGTCTPRRVYRGAVYDADRSLIDEITFVRYDAPSSYTGEDLVEIFCHGNAIVVDMIVNRCIDSGARLALPGEFTRRAFLNGKIDLTQAESVADIIGAQAQEEVKVAAKMLDGAFGMVVNDLRAQVLEIISWVAASIDFPEEEDATAHRTDQLIERIDALIEAIDTMASSYEEGKRIRDGVHVTIVGPTNAGKSSLMNAIFDEEKSIVTPVHGTTRDVVEGTIMLHGVRVIFRDTAGIRKARGIVEQEGIRRTHKAVDDADVLISVVDAANPRRGRDAQPKPTTGAKPVITVLNKIDLVDHASLINHGYPDPVCLISALTHDGITTLKETLGEFIGDMVRSSRQVAFTVNRRHAVCLKQSADAMRKARQAVVDGLTEDLFIEDLKEAQRALADIIGEITPDDILDRIFSQFCIGK